MAIFSNFLIKTAQAANEVNTLITDVAGEKVGDINVYLEKIFPLALKVGIFVAIFIIAWWGLRTIVSKVPGFKSESKDRIWDALLGLGLLLAAWLILQTINPKILEVQFDPQKGVVSNPAQ